ncbi:hypothetical protein, partial [Klebsiella pneumoniae]|uniref:hypothetical protein n=1 Tax=Klebsiella pneumoniae TaxID=573 RepID=UPI00210D6253
SAMSTFLAPSAFATFFKSNCGMAPLPRHVATGKLHALSAGAEIIRRELAAK